MKKVNIKSYCKINLTLKVLKKLNSGYHSISTLITFCDLYDLISISKIKNKKDKIIFTGEFKKGINIKSNTITKVLKLLRSLKLLKKQFFKISVKKNIPHGAGLGGGSSNAANLLNFFNFKMGFKLSKNELGKLANQIGFDVPIILEKRNSFLTGKKGEILRMNKKFKLNLLVVYPNLICSTKKIYQKSKKKKSFKYQSFLPTKKINKELINYLKKESNDLQEAVISSYPKVKKVILYIKSQKGCYFSRITGSGSACIGIFSNMKQAVYAKKLIKLKYPKYWCVVSKTI